MQNKYKYYDGYIELNNSGNTYCGATAHTIMFEAQRIHRTTKGSNFQNVLKGLCEGLKNNTLTLVKGR